MEEKEKNQKTVVAFIAGLLIGGLLVWVFSVTDNKKTDGLQMDLTPDENAEMNSEETEGTNTNTTSETTPSSPDAVVAAGAGSITVDDQPAGVVVLLGEVKMPVENGWLVVHEVNDDGSLANALGAVRYSDAEGLKPTKIELLRGTVAGKSYRVVAYTENGDRVFDKHDDMPITISGGSRVEDAFTAK